MAGMRFKEAGMATATSQLQGRSLLGLMQLVSPTLPIGAFAYSQGMETAIERGWIVDEAEARGWIMGVLQHSLVALEVPLLERSYRAWQQGDQNALMRWNRFLFASRESRELYEEERQLGRALARLLRDLEVTGAAEWNARDSQPALVTMFALAAVRWDVPMQQATEGFLWSWCENQVAAALKLVPLGQTAGQRLLLEAAGQIPAAVEKGIGLDDAAIGQSAFGLAMASAHHETQYSRLFRS